MPCNFILQMHILGPILSFLESAHSLDTIAIKYVRVNFYRFFNLTFMRRIVGKRVGWILWKSMKSFLMVSTQLYPSKKENLWTIPIRHFEDIAFIALCWYPSLWHVTKKCTWVSKEQIFVFTHMIYFYQSYKLMCFINYWLINTS